MYEYRQTDSMEERQYEERQYEERKKERKGKARRVCIHRGMG